MKSISLILFTISIIFIVMGYMEIKLKFLNKKKIEYRFIPRNIIDDQHYQTNLENSFENMFRNNDIIVNSKYSI